jgi:dolichol-phosphate mannosyltransferase
MPPASAPSNGQSPCKYSLVLPVFNEEAAIPELVRRLAVLLDRLDGPSEVIFVNDGSRDRSYQLLLDAQAAEPRFKVVNLSRNFGHQLAITAGMDLASGEAVIVLDSDLQDPPEVVIAMIEQWKRGFDVVYGVRTAREGEGLLKRLTAGLFYRLLRMASSTDIPADAGDFRLVGRSALNALRGMREHNRFVRGMSGWVGFRQTGVEYVRHARAAGESKYPLRQMVRLALHAMIGFSDLPLRLSVWTGMAISTGALLYGLYVIVLWAAGWRLVEGWTSTIVVLAFLGGVNLVMTGVVGLYVGRIHEEVKNRPLYVVSALHGFEQPPPVERAILPACPQPDRTQGA